MKKAALFCLMLLLLLPLFVRAENSHRAVIDNPSAADRLNLRKKPSESAESLGRFYSGTPVWIITEKDGWANVYLGDLTGYVRSAYLMEENRNYGAPQRFYTAETTGNSVPLRKGPKNSAGLITPIQGKVEILGDIGDDWRYVYSPSADAYGYVRANQLKNRKIDIPLAYLRRYTPIYSDKSLKKEIASYYRGTPVRVTDMSRSSGYARIEIYGLPYSDEFEHRAVEGYISLEDLQVFTQPWLVNPHAMTYQALSSFTFTDLYSSWRITVPKGAFVSMIGETAEEYHIVYGQAESISYSTGLVKKTLLHNTDREADRTGPGRTGYAYLSMETDPEGYSLGITAYETPNGPEDETVYRPLAEVLGDENGFLQLRNPDDKNFFVPNTQAKVITQDQLQVNSFRVVLPGETWTAGENDEGLWRLSVQKGQHACLTITDKATNKHEVYDVKGGEWGATYAVYIPAGARVSLIGTGSLYSSHHFVLNNRIMLHDFGENEELFRGSGRFFCDEHIQDFGTWFDYKIYPMPGAEESYCVLSNLFTEAGEEVKIILDEETPFFRTNRWDLCPGTFLELHNCIVYLDYGNG